MFLLLMDLIFLLLQLSSSFLKGCWILWMFCCWVLEFCSLTLKNVEFCFGRQLSNLQISLELSSFVYKLCYGRCKTAFSAGLGLWLLFSLSVKTDSFVIPWIVACQPPLSMGFPKQEYLSGLPFPSPAESWPRHRIHISCLVSGFLTTEPLEKPHHDLRSLQLNIHVSWRAEVIYRIC